MTSSGDFEPAERRWCLSPVSNDELRDAIGANVAKSSERCSDKGFLNMSRKEYLTLLDATARNVLSGKRGTTPKELLPLLERVGLHVATWFCLIEHFGQLFYNVAGAPQEIAKARTRKRCARYRVRTCVKEAFLS